MSIPSSDSACERAVREAEHLLALQQAAIQARRDRQEVQQRLQAEKKPMLPDTSWNLYMKHQSNNQALEVRSI